MTQQNLTPIAVKQIRTDVIAMSEDDLNRLINERKPNRRRGVISFIDDESIETHVCEFDEDQDEDECQIAIDFVKDTMFNADDLVRGVTIFEMFARVFGTYRAASVEDQSTLFQIFDSLMQLLKKPAPNAGWLVSEKHNGIEVRWIALEGGEPC